jgi:colanic acid biosynthesis glycosyl transferase WcaI
LEVYRIADIPMEKVLFDDRRSIHIVTTNSTSQNVCFINRCYWPDSEATGQLLTDLCEHLAPRWNVSVVVGQPNWETEKQAFLKQGVQDRNGVSIHRLLHSRFPKGQRWSRVRNILSFTRAVHSWSKSTGKRLIRESAHSTNGSLPRPIIVCETDPFLLPLVVGRFARKHHARVVYYLQDIYPDVAIALGVVKNGWAMNFLRSLLRRAYMNADCIVVLDEDMRNRLVGWGIPTERLKIVPNWMDCATVKPIKFQNPFRLENNVDDKFVVMHSGNMGMTQKLDVLIHAMSSNEISKNATLMLVGNGAKRRTLERQAQGMGNVSFHDYQPRESLAASLSAADLHVVSMDQSIVGCLAPSKIYGILASGTPMLAVVPKGNAVWQMVEQQRLGWTVEPDDTEGIVAAIRAAESCNPTERSEMGNRGRALALRLYDKQICCDAFEAILNDLQAN